MLGLVVGNGTLPKHLVDARKDKPLIVGVDGTTPSVPTDLTFRLSHIASFIATLKDQGITELCFAGGVTRPNLNPGEVEPESLPFVQRLVTAIQSGDGGALDIVLAIFEEAGFRIKGAHQVVPDLLPPAGVLTNTNPRPADETAIPRAETLLSTMGQADLGQACVLNKGQPIAVEALFGTDFMLQSLANRPDGAGGFLYKAPKPDQDRRIDLPTIGPTTIESAEKAKLDGVIIAADGVLLLNRKATIAAADAKGLYIWVKAP